MQQTIATLLAVAGLAAAQGVTSKVSPPSPPPAGCKPDWSGTFEISTAGIGLKAKRDVSIAPRDACDGDGTLVLTLAGGVLTDAKSRTGYIAANYQFQFDGPPQAGAIYTAGFSVCGNNSLALGGSAIFYQCQSGDFYNLYDRAIGGQCSPVELFALPCGSVGQGSDGQAGVGQGGDGQVVATQMVMTTIVKPLSDGQPQVITTAVPIALCQITDGQAQVHTTPCASVTTTMAAAKTTAAPISQYSDGQIQVTPIASGAAPPPPATGAASTPTASSPASGGSSGGSSGSSGSSAAASSTLSTTAAPKTSSSSSGSSAGSSTSSSPSTKPSSSGAGHVEMASVSALIVGIVGAVFFL